MTALAGTRSRRVTPDSHEYPTRSYDLVKEFVIALGVVTVLSLLLAAVFSSPDDQAITMSGWAQAAPGDVVATATGELAGTTTSATYGPPYNNAATGQQIAVLNNLNARKLGDYEQILYTNDDGSVLVLTYQRPGAKAAIVHDGRSTPIPWSPYIGAAAW